MAGKLTDAHFALMRKIKTSRARPAVQSDDWERFIYLADAGLVEDLGLGDARITPAGRRALSEGKEAGTNG